MALINLDSFDAYGPSGPVTGTEKWTYLAGTVGAGRRAGGYGLRDASAGVIYINPGVSDWGLGLAFYWAGTAISSILYGQIGGYLEPHADWVISVDAEGRLVAQEVTLQTPGPTWRVASTLFTATQKMVANAWNFIEVKQVGATATIRVNGTTAGSGTLASEAQIGFGFQWPVNTGMGIDDWVLYSIDAETPDFLGDNAILALFPVSDVSVEWVPLTGPSNYAMVDERPTDEEESYNHTDAPNKTDLLALDPAADLDPTLDVLGLQLVVRAEKVNTASLDLVPLIVSSGQESVGPRWGLGVGYGSFIHPLAKDPGVSGGGLAWTVESVLEASYGYRSLAPAG